MPDRDSIPITMKNGSRWRPDFIFEELLDLVDALALPHYRDVQEGAVEELRLDLASRREDDNVLSLDDEQRVHNARKINKGLAMELSVSASLTYVGLPKTVRSFCKLNKRGAPNCFAGKGDPDILTQTIAEQIRLPDRLQGQRQPGDGSEELPEAVEGGARPLQKAPEADQSPHRLRVSPQPRQRRQGQGDPGRLPGLRQNGEAEAEGRRAARADARRRVRDGAPAPARTGEATVRQPPAGHVAERVAPEAAW